ncbi:MAG: hypothetical protein ACRELG_12970, partial [Gemmataceae bacterium]
RHLLSPFSFETATIAALRERPTQPLGRALRPRPHRAARARCNGKNGRFTPWKKPMLVKAVYPVAAGGFGCTVA